MGASSADASSLLMLHLLGRCNLECLHCYMDGSPRRAEVLPRDRVLQAIADCKDLGVGTLCLTGGEPLLYPDLDRVLRAAADAGGLSTTLCTNGVLLTKRRVDGLRAMGVRLNVSVDGPPAHHDRLRDSRGAFGRTERGVRLAVDAAVPVTIVATVSRANLDSVEFLAQWCRAAGVEQLLVQPLLDLGRGRRIADECLSFSQLNRLILRLSDLANRQSDRRMPCQVIGAKKKFLMDHPCGAFVRNGVGCHRGVTKEIKKLVVREDGTVLPEVPNLSHRYALGRIQDAPLGELVDRYFEHGYAAFDRMCRVAYSEVLPSWDCVVVPWEQIVAERSHTWVPHDHGRPAVAPPVCASSTYGACGSARLSPPELPAISNVRLPITTA